MFKSTKLQSNVNDDNGRRRQLSDQNALFNATAPIVLKWAAYVATRALALLFFIVKRDKCKSLMNLFSPNHLL
jgi:hypothetical protein